MKTTILRKSDYDLLMELETRVRTRDTKLVNISKNLYVKRLSALALVERGILAVLRENHESTVFRATIRGEDILAAIQKRPPSLTSFGANEAVYIIHYEETA